MVAILHKWLLVVGLWAVQPQSYTISSATQAEAYHPFYISVTEINHNSQDKIFEISCKIFVDDMEAVLKQNYKTAIDLSNEKQKDLHDKLLADYISKNLLVAADGKGGKLSYIGYEKESESVYCYFEVSNVPSVKKLDITNSILQDYIDKQINIMHITVNGNRKSYKLDYPNKQASFNF
jgi:hypothetical protein